MTKYTAEQIVANREKWAAALESGKWKQCRRAWESSGAYCCLGVLNIIVHGEATPRGDGQRGLTADSVGLSPSGGLQEFINANDARGKTFPEIAKMVRALPAPEVSK